MLETIKILNKLEDWARSGCLVMMDKISKNLAISYRNRIRSGLNADGSRSPALTESTMKSHTRQGDVPSNSSATIRSKYGNTPLVATGKTVDSIQSKKTDNQTWEIGPVTDRGVKIINSNATRTHHGFPFAGDTPKKARDPLTLEDPQMDFIEDQIVQDLERMLGV